MKKILFILALALSASFWGCGDDDGSKADLKWINEDQYSAINDIQWINSSTLEPDQTWRGETKAKGGETDYRGINLLSGQAYGVDGGGNAFDIELTSTGSKYVSVSNGTDKARVEENANAIIVISDLQTKKK